MNDRLLGRLASQLAFVLAWSPFVLLWTWFAAGQRGGGNALTSGIFGVAPAALLSLIVWRLCGRLPWPGRLSLRFYFQHLGLATAYALAWILASRALHGIQTGGPMPRELWSRLTIMQLLTGIALYGVIAGVSYALRISGQLRDKEVSAERAHMLAVSARLEALRARLDPHFMFNALHTLRALVRYDPPRAERAIDELADMLRYSLRSDPGGVVTLREEWGFMAKYVEFQRLRFEDRLRVEVTMPSDAADWPVPAFCLQTLVENAVRHAVEPDPVGGTIVIETAREGDRLRIAVRDSGSGATDAKTAGSGSGLASLRERLTTLYGDRASVESQSLVPSGFEVRLLLPALPAADIQGPAIV